jgi:hypothetical protein
MRTTLLAIMVALPAIAVLGMAFLTMTYRRFRRDVPELRTPEDIRRLRSLAKLHMYVSLLGHPYVTIGGVVAAWIVGWLVFKELGWLDLLLFGLLPIIVAVVVAAIGESPARMAKTIPVRDAALAAERDHIVDVWIHRLFPDW